MIDAVVAAAPELGVQATCDAFGVPRATYYRHRAPMYGPKQKRPSPLRRLPAGERAVVLATLNEGRFANLAPAEVYAALLEEGRYLCLIRTMHRILEENAASRERRNQRRHPTYRRPELLATAPNQLWSWDITKLRGPAKWTYYYLYVILDVYSRYIVGWMVAHREQASLAKKLIAATCERQGIQPDALTLHADRGQVPSLASFARARAINFRAASGVTPSVASRLCGARSTSPDLGRRGETFKVGGLFEERWPLDKTSTVK